MGKEYTVIVYDEGNIKWEESINAEMSLKLKNWIKKFGHYLGETK